LTPSCDRLKREESIRKNRHRKDSDYTEEMLPVIQTAKTVNGEVKTVVF